MIILAVETSCDDTSIAIFRDDKLLSMDTKSQIKLHEKTWWVVPEVAAREHANTIFEVFENVLNTSKITFNQIDYIAVTTKPWLIPSLLTWITFARTLWNILKKPVLEIDHIEGHIFSNFLDRKETDIEFPLVCLTISWWHNDLYFMKNMWNMQRIWTSNDDSAWESFDKVAKMMGLCYPWWPIISSLAKEYKKDLSKNNLFPRVFLKKDEFDFSFSWLKSAVKREIDKRVLQKWSLSIDDKREIAYEFQNAVNEVLAYKLILRALKNKVQTIMLAWWVSANDDLKEKISFLALKNNLKFIYPVNNLYCMDNAAMIWILAYYKTKYQKF